MNIPWVSIISAVAAGGGLFGLWWYQQLNEEEKKQADELAGQYAIKMFNKVVPELTGFENYRVNQAVKTHFIR
jgi:hypothetical protein